MDLLDEIYYAIIPADYWQMAIILSTSLLLVSLVQILYRRSKGAQNRVRKAVEKVYR